MAFFYKFFFQFNIVFDNTVMNNRKFTVSAKMRVSVGFARSAVGSPTGVTYTDTAGHCLAAIGFINKISYSFNCFCCSYFAVRNYCNTGRVISAIFQFFKSIEQNGRSRVYACKSYNSAHI